MFLHDLHIVETPFQDDYTYIHSTFISQFVRFSRNCNNSEGVKARILFLFNLLVSLGFYSTKLVNAFRIYMLRRVINLIQNLLAFVIFFL